MKRSKARVQSCSTTIRSYRRQLCEAQNSPLANLTSGDEYAVELELIAQVLAYAKLAYKRFGDHIPMRVEQSLVVPLDKMVDLQFQKRIFESEDVDERCRALMVDAPELVEMRRELMGKLEVLRRAEQEVSKSQA